MNPNVLKLLQGKQTLIIDAYVSHMSGGKKLFALNMPDVLTKGSTYFEGNRAHGLLDAHMSRRHELRRVHRHNFCVNDGNC